MTSPLKRPGLTVTVLVCLVILGALGTWQMRRLAWKQDLISAVEARVDGPSLAIGEALEASFSDQRYQPVTAEVEPLSERLAFVQALNEGEAGWMVFQAVELVGEGQSALLNHGFISTDVRREGAYAVPSAPLQISGLLRPGDPTTWMQRAFAAPPDLEEGTFYSREPAPLIEWLSGDSEQLPFSGVTIDRDDNRSAEASPLGGRTRIAFSNKHLSYALTWYGLGLTMVGVYIAMLRRGR